MIEVEGNRLYLGGVFVCYAAYALPKPISGHCYLSFSHRHGRDLLSCDGKAWMGDNDGSMPGPDIVIGRVVSSTGLVPDPEVMGQIVKFVQSREDEGRNTKVEIKC